MVSLERFFRFASVLFISTSIGVGFSPSALLAKCPNKEKIQTGIQKTFPKLQFEIIKVSPTKFNGLCQIQVKVSAQNHLLYTDAQGEFILTGNLHEVKTGINLTQETLMSLNRLTSEELQQLQPLTAFTLGRGKRIVYLATDPQCPYCKQAETLLKKLVDKEELQVRFLLFPLDIHKGAREQCISILCDNKGVEGYDSGYQSANQCLEGIKKIDSTIAFLNKKGINSTPSFIFEDGLYLSGLPSEEQLRKRLGL